MARSVATIKANMLADIAADSTLNTKLTSSSLTAIYNLWCYIVASAINLFEQVQDKYIATAEATALKTPPATPLWIQNQIFNYQYDSSGAPATNVVVINSDFSVGYATKNTAYNIVTLCSVSNTLTNGLVAVKVAKGSLTAGYSKITGTALTQLDGFLSTILPAGINHSLVSLDTDYISVVGTIYYKNGYAGVVKANVVASIKAYLDSISISNVSGNQSVNYTGIVKVSEIENAILKTEGVSDVNISSIYGRANTVAFASSTLFYDLATGINQRTYNCASGYASQDTTPHDWLTTLTFTAAI